MKNYTVRITDATTNGTYETGPLTRAEALVEVKKQKQWLREHDDDRKVFVIGPRNNMYLNPDGNHDITGKAW